MIDDSYLKSVLIVEKIAECHQSALDLFGREFESKIKPFRNALQTLIARQGYDTTTAGLVLMKDLRDKNILDSMGILMIAAAIYVMHK